MSVEALPEIIQGGMGIGVSGWPLAHAVSTTGQLGVVSGAALDALFIRRLQDGDVGGHLRRAMEAFPFPEVATDALKRFFRPEGRGLLLINSYMHVVEYNDRGNRVRMVRYKGRPAPNPGRATA